MRKLKMPKKWKFWKKRPPVVQIDPRLGEFGLLEVEAIDKKAHFVVPEVWPDLASALLKHGCPNVHFWWLSVDNFPLSALHQLSNQNVIRTCSHLCQSEYAADFARKFGGTKISMLTDFVDLPELETPKPLDERNIDICYLPNKARGTESLFDSLSERFNIVPLQNMSKAEIVDVLSNCKVFLDCGFHPGKDRVPREAAMCGCLPVIRREGAARFYEDVPLPDALFVETDLFFQPEELRQKLEGVIENSADFAADLKSYRDVIKSERARFEAELGALAEAATL